ncbi:MAG: AAA family ATPase [Eubacteriales bacterium]|nr:AAA family ATPase [Eubacteriales bacterium]
MLIKFEVENFKNFSKKLVFDLSKYNNYGFNEHLISKENACITKGIVYGKNGSGKSNLGLAIMDIVAHLTDNMVLYPRYELYENLSTGDSEVKFTYTFRFENHLVVYSYVKESIDELLKESFSIDDKEYINYNYKTNRGKSDLKGSEVLNLTSPSSEVSRVKFILNTTVLEDNEVNRIFLKFGNFVNQMLLFYSLDDRGYQGLIVGTKKITELIIRENKVDEFQNFLKEAGIDYDLFSKEDDIYCHFPERDVNLFSIASTGTKSISLLFYWYIQFQKTSFVFIDEFDAFYHFELAKHIIKQLNQLNNNQIFLTSHNTDLMTNDLLRPDCCFVLSQNKITSLSDATDKDLRQAHNLQKMYKAGAFGV